MAHIWLTNPWLVWGLGTYLAINTGCLASILALESVIRLPVLSSAFITYSDKGERVPPGTGHATRFQRITQNQQRAPFTQQLRQSLFIITGPYSMVSSALLSLFMRCFMPMPTSWLPASGMLGALVQYAAMAVFADFFLYWCHRAMHEVPYLWTNHHSYHHRVNTPTPVSHIDCTGLDATVQGGIPVALAFLICRPAPVVMYVFLALRISESALDHTGLDSPLINWLTLKVLPLRAGVAFHDAHHKFCYRAMNARNFAETFWLWDWAFGTMM